MDFGNHLDDFEGRSRCQSKIHDEGHPKPFQLASERWCMLGSCQPCFIITVSVPSAGALGYYLSKMEFDSILKVIENFSVWILYVAHCF